MIIEGMLGGEEALVESQAATVGSFDAVTPFEDILAPTAVNIISVGQVTNSIFSNNSNLHMIHAISLEES